MRISAALLAMMASGSAVPLAAAADPAPAPQVLDVYPAKARDAGVEGKATIGCAHDAHNVLKDCTLVSESPEGLGFGDVALAVAAMGAPNPYARLNRGEADAREKVTFWFHLKPPSIFPDPFAPRPVQVLAWTWARTPTAAQVLEATPRGPGVIAMDASVRMECWVDDKGALRECKAGHEHPAGVGYGAAALKLAQAMSVVPTGPERTMAGARIQFTFPFPVPEDPPPTPPPASPAERTAAAEIMKYYPEAERRAGVQGNARLRCGRDSQNRPTNCVVVYESPQGRSFGAAALKLASQTPPNTTVAVEPKADREYLDYLFCLQPRSITPNTLLPRPAIVAATVDHEPTAEDKLRVYPAEALSGKVGGVAMLVCRVGLDHRLKGCKVGYEFPEDRGFAAAALAVAPDYLVSPRTIDGVPQADERFVAVTPFGDKPAMMPPPAPPAPPNIDWLCRDASK